MGAMSCRPRAAVLGRRWPPLRVAPPLSLPRRRSLVTAEAPKPIKRFYDRAAAREVEGVWRVMLDERVVKTPKGTVLDLPTRAVAEAVAAEWDGQSETLRPKEMPLTTIGCTAIDLIRPEKDQCIERMLPYLATDTVCYEDDSGLLAELQAKEWGSLREWFQSHVGVTLSVARGLGIPNHPEGTLEAVEKQLRQRDEWELCALEIATQTAKSLIVATALLDREGTSPPDALRWAMLEEFFQIERWGLVEGEHDVSHSDSLAWLQACQRFVHTKRQGNAVE